MLNLFFQTERVLGPQACPQCAKVFCNRYRMLRHLKSCRMSSNLKGHDLSGGDSPNWDIVPKGPIVCPVCSKLFTTRKALREHERNIHATYDCELCDSVGIPSKTAMLEHVMIAHRGTLLLILVLFSLRDCNYFMFLLYFLSCCRTIIVFHGGM